MVSLVLFANPGKLIQKSPGSCQARSISGKLTHIIWAIFVTGHAPIIPFTLHNVRFRFASCAQGMISGVPLIRLVREMCQRVRTWSVLSGIFRKKLYLIHNPLYFRLYRQ